MNTVNPAQVLCSEEGNWFVASGGLTEPLQGTEADCKRIAAALNAQAGVVEALRAITDDYADRFDVDDPATNPGIRHVIAQARAALAAIKEKDRG